MSGPDSPWTRLYHSVHRCDNIASAMLSMTGNLSGGAAVQSIGHMAFAAAIEAKEAVEAMGAYCREREEQEREREKKASKRRRGRK